MAGIDITPLDTTVVDTINNLISNDADKETRVSSLESLLDTNGEILAQFILDTVISAGYTSGGVTTTTVPAAPSGIFASSTSYNSALISFTPGNTGGSDVLYYTVVASNGYTATGTSSPINMPQLPSGGYTFGVVATNSVGNSNQSSPSNYVTVSDPPPILPDPPTSVVATGGNTTASLSWTAPVNTGGLTITGYLINSVGPTNVTNTVQNNSTTLTGLTAGSYSFYVQTVTSAGSSAIAGVSNTVTVAGALAVPGAPTSVVATGGILQASIAFVAPTFNGNTAITGYTAISSSGASASGTSSPIIITESTAGSYTYTVKASNSVGTGPASTASSSTTVNGVPTVPGAPTSVVATGGTLQSSVVFTAPANNGSAITGYVVTSSTGATATGTSSPIVIAEFAAGSYTYTVYAMNSIGNGPPSSASSAATVTNPINLLPANYANTSTNILNFKTGSSSGTIPTLSKNTAIVRTPGGTSVKAVINAASPCFVGPNYSVPVTAGATISGLVSMYCASAAAHIAPQISFFSDAGNTYISNVIASSTTATQNAWVDLTMTATVPVGATYAQIQGNVLAPNPTVGDTIYLTQFEIANGTVTSWTADRPSSSAGTFDVAAFDTDAYGN